jgi:hypothetical protein
MSGESPTWVDEHSVKPTDKPTIENLDSEHKSSDVVVTADGAYILSGYMPKNIGIAPEPALFRFKGVGYTVEKLDLMEIDELIILRCEMKEHLRTVYSSSDYYCITSMTVYNLISNIIHERRFELLS